MGQRKCAKDGCNRLEFRVSGFCLKHKDSIVPRSKPESILIKSSDITDHQSKKPGRSSNPTVEKKERIKHTDVLLRLQVVLIIILVKSKKENFNLVLLNQIGSFML